MLTYLIVDVLAAPFEDRYAESHPDLKPDSSYSDFATIYTHCVNELRNVTDPSSDPKWAIRFFSYDRLALVNVKAFVDVGGWDTFIPFYLTDCDMHERLTMNGWNQREVEVGYIWDVASSLDDLIVLYRKEGTVEASFIDPNLVEEQFRKENEGKEGGEGGGKIKREENPTSTSSKWKDDILARRTSTSFGIPLTTCKTPSQLAAAGEIPGSLAKQVGKASRSIEIAKDSRPAYR